MISKRRLWFFRIAAAFVAILVPFAVLELGLRVAGYGYPTDFFLRNQVKGRPVIVENPRFAWRFMPPSLARSPQPVLAAAKKPADTCRIFILGESAALGDPEPAFGLPRLLKVLLSERFPNRKFEVIPTAMTAINSHAITAIADDCAKYDGDFWVVYMGNNEVTGPFGPGTVFGKNAPGRSMLRAGLALKTTRTGQLVDDLARRISNREAPVAWGGMEMFTEQQVRHDDPRLDDVYRNFNLNLSEIINAGVSSGAKVIVSTVASNLRDNAPFSSQNSPRLDESARTEWKRLFDSGVQFQAADDSHGATNAFLRAAAIDPSHAELQFRLGRCAVGVTNLAAAAEHFRLARDLDTLRFRTDSRLNASIREITTRQPSDAVRLLDVETTFARNSPFGVPGDEFFWEHVHFRFPGNYLLAVAVAHQIAELLLPAGDKNAGNWLTIDECARRLAITRWADYRLTEGMLARLTRPPFVNQLNQPFRLQRLAREMTQFAPGLRRDAFERQVNAYRHSIGLAPDDWVAHDQFAKFLQGFGQTNEAAAEWRKVLDLIPHHLTVRAQLGNLLASDPAAASEAAQHLQDALRLHPHIPELQIALGRALATQRQFDTALVHFDTAIQLRPELPTGYVERARVLEQQGRGSEGIVTLRSALRANSNSVPARVALGTALNRLGRTNEAAMHFGTVLRLDSGNATARAFFNPEPQSQPGK